MFGWFRKLRRRRWLAQPFPEAWAEIVRRHVKQSAWLPDSLAQRWRQRIQVFVNATCWEGCRDFPITDEVRVVIAANATLLTLGLADEWLDCVRHVLVHPTPYQGRRSRLGADGVDYSHGDWMRQLEDDLPDEHYGEAWVDSGTVILVWSEVPTADHITPPGQNVVLHEFAHVLHQLRSDWMQTAQANDGRPWLEAFQAEFTRQVRESDQGRRSLLDDYAAENLEEFFCVATEYFFERPARLRDQRPSLYRLCQHCYAIDPTP